MSIEHLIQGNRAWAERIQASDPDFFRQLLSQQTPRYLWIGCSDSRVPATEITGQRPGGIFVHRNVANLVHHGDLNCLSVMQFAIEVLRVEHVIVCGHYGCGGVAAAMDDQPHGLIDNWLRPIRETWFRHRQELDLLADPVACNHRMCELNVIAQVGNVASTTVVEEAWRRGQQLQVHGLIYSLEDGHLKDLQVSTSRRTDATV